MWLRWRIVRRTLMETQRKEWRKMKTKMGELMDVGEDEQLPKAVTFQHPVAKIASRVNRMRTQKTRFQQTEWKKTFCRLECVEEIGFQCEKCAACGNGGRWSFRWTKCSCTDEKGQRMDKNIEHMLIECKATQGSVRRTNCGISMLGVLQSEQGWMTSSGQQMRIRETGRRHRTGR